MYNNPFAINTNFIYSIGFVMKLPFRQGIVKYSVNNDKVPTFLYTDKRDRYVSLIAGASNVTVAFADNDVDYLFDERETTNNAWGPLDRNIKYWLFWDLNLLDGKRSFGYTTLEPIISEELPYKPLHGQHWFTLDNVSIFTDRGFKQLKKHSMYVWDNDLKQWSHKLRLFAGTYYNGDMVASSLSSQVGVFQNCYAGYILYDDFDSPTKQARSDGSYKFLTSLSHFYESKQLTTTISLDSLVQYGKASSTITKYKLVKSSTNNSIGIASNTDISLSPAIGIMEIDLNENEIGIISNHVYIINDDWRFNQEPSSPIYLTSNGDFSTSPPLAGFIQQVGYVVSKNTVFIDTTYQIIYHDVITTTNAMPVNLDINSGKLYTSFNAPDGSSGNSSIFYNLYGNIYKQPIPNDVWIIAHNSHLQQFLIQIYDDRGFLIIPNNIRKRTDKIIEVEFNKKIQGTALVFLF